ncbi:D-lactate dehydrogenase [Ceratobasidium theobromae]|uniref:D-lactate dehydrogenase n=1 Tax=Ceratobasidium theobromae TaxID=1582974 RepID=A0A5N5QPP3_9AGAM|nr:D-lactate dehydrogenase [Ceratobasidium theobromae]
MPIPRHLRLRRFRHVPPTFHFAALRSMATIHRGDYATLTEDDVKHFATILASTSILSSLPPFNHPQSDLDSYNNDWMGKYKGHSKLVLKPKSTTEVSAVLKHCYERKLAVVPQGGNTGLVGSAVPANDEVILSLANMSKIRTFDPMSGIIVQKEGKSASCQKIIYVIDLPYSCQIGGNISTNAGGLRVLRYGSLHGSVLGLEVVLPNGEILDQLSTMRKDNTGYDLKQLFIGAEGTLGIVTAVSILCPPAPRAQQNLVLALPSYDKLPEVFKLAKTYLSEVLSAFELFDREAYDLVCHHTGKRGLDENEIGDSKFFVLIETSGGRAEHDEEKLSSLLETLYATATSPSPLINSGVLSQSTDQFASLWSLREGIPEAAGKTGKVYKYDISVPVREFMNVTNLVRNRLQERGLYRCGPSSQVSYVMGYGHVGDGNLHINVVANAYNQEIEKALEPFVFEVVQSHKGSISAEHGLGLQKTQHLHYSKSQVSRDWMRRVKLLFDDKGIMNPGKVVARETKPWQSLTAGTFAGAVEAFITYPTEFVKTRSQFDGNKVPKDGPIAIIRDTWAKHGPKGFYSGCTALVVGNAAKAGVRFVSYDKFKQMLADKDGRVSAPRSLVGAGMMEAILAVTPSETIKTKLIDDSKLPQPRFRGLIHGSACIVREEGLLGIYRGLFPVMMRQGANSAVRFTTYSTLKQFVQSNMRLREGVPLPSSVTFGVGAVAGLVTVYTTMPLDVIKTRMQSLKARSQYKNSFDCAYQTFVNDGITSFWRGTTPRLARLMVSSPMINS